MKQLNLNDFGVVELKSQSLNNTNGGFLFLLALAVEVGCYAAAGDIMLNFNSYASAIRSKSHGGASGSW